MVYWKQQNAPRPTRTQKGCNGMNQTYQALFTPWKIGNVEIKNRIVLCPMGGTSLFGWMEPNHFDKEAAHFFMERARNNVGLIIPGNLSEKEK